MTEPGPRVHEALARARAVLADASEHASVDAQVLLAHVLGRGRAWLIAHAHDTLSAGESRDFEALVARRHRGEPVAYLLGCREFWSLELRVTPAVLVPRPDTECLVEQVLERIATDEPATVLDAGTGSGAVALAIAVERPRAWVLASDRDGGALAVAAGNVSRHAPGRVVLLQADWLSPLAGAGLDVIASNPPYVAAADPHLRQGDVRFEPHAALVADDDGLAAIARLARQAPECLAPDGWLLVEHGACQGVAVRRLFTRQGFRAVTTARDLAGHERVTAGRRGVLTG